MAPPKGYINSLTFLAPNAVVVKFRKVSNNPIMHHVQWTKSGTGWGAALMFAVAGNQFSYPAPIPADGYAHQWAFRVRTVDSSGTGPWSDIERIYIPGPPRRPNAPTLNLTRPLSMTVAWMAPNNEGAAVIEYQVAYRPVGGGYQYLTTKKLSVVITDLAIGATMQFQVRARNSQGWGPWSDTSSMMIDGGPRVRHGNTWKHSVAYVRVGGTWRRAIPFVRTNGVWKPGMG